MANGRSVGQVALDLVANEKPFMSQANAACDRMRSAFSKASKAMAAVGIGLSLKGFTSSCIEAAANAQQLSNRIATVFPQMQERVDAFCATASEKMGMGAGAAKKMMASFGMMAEGMGFTESAAANMSAAMTQMAGDMAAFYGITQDEAASKLQGVFTGMTRGLKTLGVNMSEANLQAHALSLGISKQVSDMTDAELAALRLSYAQQQLEKTSGYAQRNLGTWAGQTALLDRQFAKLKSTLGQGMVAALLPVVKAINAVLAGLVRLAQGFNALIEAVTGQKLGSLLGGAAGVTIDLGEAAEDAGDSTYGLADAQKDAAKAAKAEDKAQKALSRTLAGFDRINKLQAKQKEAAAKGGGTTGGGSGLGALSTELAQFEGALDGAKAKADAIKLPPTLVEACERLRDALSELFGVLSKAGKWAWDNVLEPLGEWTLSKLAPAVVDVLAGAFRVLSKVLEGLAPIGQFVWEHFLKPLAGFAGDAVVTMLEGLAGALNAIADFAGKHPKAFSGIAAGLGALFASRKVKAAGGFAKLLGKAKLAIGQFLFAISGKAGPAKLGKFGSAVAKLFKRFPIKNPIVLALTAIVGALGYVYKNWGKLKKTKIGQAVEKLRKKLEPLAGRVGESVRKLMEKLVELGGKLWKALQPIVEKVLDKVLDWAGDAADALGNGLVGAIDGLCDVVDAISDAWDGLPNATKTLTAEVKKKGEDVWNTVSGWWDSLKDKAATLTGTAAKAGDSVWATVRDWWGELSDKVVTLTAEAKEKADGALDKLHGMWTSIQDRAAQLTAKVATAWSDIKDKWDGLTSHIADKVADFKGKVATAWSDISSKWTGLTSHIVGKTVDFKAKVATTWNSLKSKWSKLIGHFKDKTVNISMKFSAAASDLRQWIDSNVLSKIRSVLGKVPVIGASAASAIHLAQGGFVARNTPRLAVIGDNTREGEIVSPESKFQKMLDKASAQGGDAAQLLPVLSAILAAIQALDRGVYLDGRALMQSVARHANAQTQATGRSPFVM